MSGEVKITPSVLLEDGQVLTYEVLRDLIEGLTAEILAASITARELADGSISADKLDSSVQSQLGVPDGIVTTAKLADGALTADAAGRAKMADGFVEAAKIADGTLTATQLDAGLVWPSGVIIEWPGETVPAGWLECNGAAKSRTTYANIFAVTGILWGAGDGSTTFNLPDSRGIFFRGWDHGAGNDPDASIRTGGDHVGSSQDDALAGHVHQARATPIAASASTVGSSYAYLASGTASDMAVTTGGNETRPKNKNAMYIIKI